MAPRKKGKASLPVSPKTFALFVAKLESSGLDLADAEALGMSPLDPDQTHALSYTFDAKPALRIDYFDAFGQPASDWPKSPPFYRLRYLGDSVEFTALTAEAKKGKYTQLADTAPCVYLPRTINWGDLLPDAETPVLITEGELKAAKACKEGFPTIGLGGVWNFKSNNFGYDLLPALKEFNWVRRHVYIVFDSDLSTNQNVVAALNNLAKELYQYGAFVHLTWLPEVLGPDVKVGLDDFLVYKGEAGVTELEAILKDADLLGVVQQLFDLNERYVYVANPGLLIDQQTQAKHKPSALNEHLAAGLTINAKELTPEGDIRWKRVSAGPAWIKWPLRTEVSKVTYAPGAPRFTMEGKLHAYNTWAGWGVEPKKGDIKPFLALLNHLFKGAEPEALDWFIRWLAYPLIYPGSKIFSSAVIHGRRHGTGKSLIGYTMSEIYGKNFTEIKQDDLHANFNEWAENKQFIMGDDVTGSNKRQDNDVLKKLITQKKVRVNPKYVPSYEVPDCINYLFTSNHADAFFLEDDDRRFFIHEVKVPPLDEDFYMEYGLWLVSGGGAAVFDHLLKVDLAGFNPNGHALRTQAKDRMISDVRSDLGAWVRHLLESPEVVLKMGEIPLKKDLFTNRELLMFYDPTGRTGTTANGLGRELRRAGAIQVLDGRPVRTETGQDRYYAIRNVETWESASQNLVLEHLKARAPLGKSNGKAKY